MELMEQDNVDLSIAEKLTKSAISKFIIWSTSRYNNYLGYGNKKENVDLIFNSIFNGYFIERGKKNESLIKFEIECSGGNGEGCGNRYWRLKGRKGDYKYEVDCKERTIKGMPSGIMIKFK
jgi:hypothetical protein